MRKSKSNSKRNLNFENTIYDRHYVQVFLFFDMDFSFVILNGM